MNLLDIQKRSYSSYFLIILLFIFMGLLLFNGCASSRRGKLSDAMEKASDDYEGERVIESEDTEDDDEYYYDDDDEYEYDSVEHDDEQLVSEYDSVPPKTSSKINRFGITFGSGLLHSDEYYGLNHFNLNFHTGKHDNVYFTGGFSWAPIQETSELTRSIKGNIKLLNIGIGFQKYTTPPYTFMGQYFYGGINFNYMFWSYNNPIEIIDYDTGSDYYSSTTIRSDRLKGLEFYAGVGIHLIQTKSFRIGGSLSPGVILWFWDTDEGFSNDVFDPFFYLKFKIHLTFGIRD